MGAVMTDDEKVQNLIKYTGNSTFDIEEARVYLRWVLDGELWREFRSPNGNVMTNESFAEFVTAPKWKGLQSSIDSVKVIADGDVKLLDAVDKELQRKPGNPAANIKPKTVVGGAGRCQVTAEAVRNKKGQFKPFGNNIPNWADRPEGTSQAKALRRLRKDRPDLHAKVLAEEVSAHGAMVEAGFRPRTFTVRADSAASIAATLRKQLDAQVLRELVELLKKTLE